MKDGEEHIEEVEEQQEDDEEEKVDTQAVAKAMALKKAKKLLLPKDLPTKFEKKGWRPKHGKDTGTAQVQPYHRAKLRALLDSLIRERQYLAASGPVSVLLQAHSREDVYQNRDLHYYWAAMEILRQTGTGRSYVKKIKRLFRILQRKQLSPRMRGNVQVGLALYLMSLGDIDSYESSYNEIRPLVDIPPFRDDPVISLCYGYIQHRIWHYRAAQDVEKQFVEDLGARPQHGVDQEDYEEGGGDNDYTNADECREDDDMVGLLDFRHSTERHIESAEFMELEEMEDKPSSSQVNLHGLYEDNEQDRKADEVWKSIVVLWSPDLDRRLFPVRLPQTRTKHVYKVPMGSGRSRDAHTTAVKYLRIALSQNTDLTPALVPLVQLLMAAGDVRGALEEIEKFSNNLHLIPLSIKALLLESVAPKGTSQLAKCYESILRINPSSLHSLDILVQLHASGKYRTETLVEYIAIHLDVERGQLEIWQQLAACLLLLSQQKDREIRTNKSTMSGLPQGVTEDGRGVEKGNIQDFSVWRKNIWDDRSSWWRRKHFHEKSIDVEQQVDVLAKLLDQQTSGFFTKGDWRRISCKAACSIHIIGLGNVYEVTIRKRLNDIQAESLFSLVEEHVICQLINKL